MTSQKQLTKKTQKTDKEVIRTIFSISIFLIFSLFIFSCSPPEEMSAEEINAIKGTGENELLAKTVIKHKTEPGDTLFKPGRQGGEWISTLQGDPKTFNTLTARDGDSRAAIDLLYPSLLDYDPLTRQFLPALAEKFSFEVVPGGIDVHYTLRDDLFWSNAKSESTIQATADDVVFWYNEIDGDPALQLPGYPGQFVDMPDGSEKRIEIEKTGKLSFVFHIPREVANPFLMTSTTFGPLHVFKKEKEERGVEGLLELYTVDTEVSTIDSLGSYRLTEYTPGVRLVVEKNPYYYKKDKEGQPLPYINKITYKIVSNKNTERLIFITGDKDNYSLLSEDLDTLLSKEPRDYTVYNGGTSLGSAFLTFNQNPNNLDEVKHKWFAQTEFRQAMSSLVNRKRIIRQEYRGLADPALHFYAKANPFYDESIKQEFTYNPQRAAKLLKRIGIKPDKEGIMRDQEGNAIEFTLSVGIENPTGINIATIFADDCEKTGIKVSVKPIDFQKLVDQIMNSYDWESVIVSLGPNYWPEGGSNVWPSDGNFHIWRPLQPEPATKWEAEIDQLWNTGAYTADPVEAKPIWDKYQRLILNQCPVIYLVHPYSFLAVRNKWENVYYDTLSNTELEYYYLKP